MVLFENQKQHQKVATTKDLKQHKNRTKALKVVVVATVVIVAVVGSEKKYVIF